MTTDFIGAGWSFPLRVAPTNSIALARQVRRATDDQAEEPHEKA